MILVVLGLVMATGFTYATIQGPGGVIVTGPGEYMIYYKMSTPIALELSEAICHNKRYQDYVDDLDPESSTFLEPILNPESCAQFTDRVIRETLVQEIVKYRRWQAEQAIVIQQPTIS